MTKLPFGFHARWPVVGTVAVVFFASTIGLIIAANAKVIDLNILLGAVGSVLSAFGLAFGCYFAILAVDAYGHLRQIREARETFDATSTRLGELQTTMKGLHERVATTGRDMYSQGDRMFSAFAQFVQSIPKGTSQKNRDQRTELLNNLQAHRARFLLGNPELDLESVQTHILTIKQLNDTGAIPILDELSKDTARTAAIRELAGAAVKALRARKDKDNPSNA